MAARAFAAAVIFARCSGDCGPFGLPLRAALIFARVSGECFLPLRYAFPLWTAPISARASGVWVLPLLAAPIFARVSGAWVLPLRAAPIFARVSGECTLPFLAALNFARCSGENTRVFVGISAFPVLKIPPSRSDSLSFPETPQKADRELLSVEVLSDLLGSEDWPPGEIADTEAAAEITCSGWRMRGLVSCRQ